MFQKITHCIAKVSFVRIYILYGGFIFETEYCPCRQYVTQKPQTLKECENKRERVQRIIQNIALGDWENVSGKINDWIK